MLDNFFISVKVGDNGAYRDGMLIDYFDETETGVDFYKALTPDCSKKFRFVQVDRRMKPKIIDLLPPVGFTGLYGPMGEPIPSDKYQVRGGVLPLVDLAAFCKVSAVDIRDQVSAKAPINGLLIGEEMFKSSLTLGDTKIPDKAAIAGGACTIGSGGAAPNYLTWALFGADVTTLTSALTATQIAAVTETAQCAINVALAGFALNLTSSVNPLGNYNLGWLITHNAALSSTYGILITCTSASSGSIITVSNLKFLLNGTYTLYGGAVAMNSNTANITNNLNDCIVNGNTKSCICFRGGTTSSPSPFNMFNCVAANGRNTQTNGYAFGLGMIAGTTPIIENCSFYNFTRSVGLAGGFLNYLNTTLSIKNLACFDNYIDYSYRTTLQVAGMGNTVNTKCASSDTTGSEADLRSLVAATEFQSLSITSPIFLKLFRGRTLGNAGVAPSIAANTYGIRGNPRPRSGHYSIGADEVGAHHNGQENGLERALHRGLA